VLKGSVLFPRDASHSSSSGSDILAILVMSGIVGSGSALMLRRSYTTIFQFCTFFAAIICVDKGNILECSRTLKRSAFRRCTLRKSTWVDSENCQTVLLPSESGGKHLSTTLKISNLALNGTLVFTLTITSLWVSFALLNFSESLHLHHGQVNAVPILDHDYIPSLQNEIVISMYKEPISSVATLVSSLKSIPSLSRASVHIYTKDETANVSAILYQTGAHNVTLLPNVGREGETYLHHILSQWDSLAKHTLFIQGSVHNPREFFARLRDFYDPDRTGMLSLGFSGHLCDCHDCGDQWGWNDTAGLISQIYSRVYGSLHCSNVLLSYKGQFIASGRRIRGIDREIYRELHVALTARNGREDSLSAPVLGYTLERLWNVLFQCSDLGVAWKCPSLLSGKRWGGNIGDCQCFDE
jgi:hypothetical protein